MLKLWACTCTFVAFHSFITTIFFFPLIVLWKELPHDVVNVFSFLLALRLLLPFFCLDKINSIQHKTIPFVLAYTPSFKIQIPKTMLTVVQTHGISCCIDVLEKGVQYQLRGTGIDEWSSSNLESQTTKSLACRG